MTTKEEKSVEMLVTSLRQLREENAKFREDITQQVKSINEKTEKKHLPVYYEQDILKTAQQSIQEAIGKSLTDYGSPLKKLVDVVINTYSDELKQLISDSFSQTIRTPDFKQSIVTAFSHKVAKAIISNNDGLFDKVSNELKQDAIFKSKMALAVSTVVEECLKDKK